MCFGSPILSLIGEKTGSYLGTVIGAGIIMILESFFLITSSLSQGQITISFIIIGVCSVGK